MASKPASPLPPPTVPSVAYRLPLPPSTNNLFITVRTGLHTRRVRSREYTTWTAAALASLRLQGVLSVAPPVAIGITIEGGKGFSRARDADNFCKAILDLMTATGVIPTDNLTCVVDLRVTYRKVTGASGVVVSVEQQAMGRETV